MGEETVGTAASSAARVGIDVGKSRDAVRKRLNAWIAASLPDTAIKALHCEAHQSPEGATAQWVRRAALMRFASTAVRLQEWHVIVGLPLPFPVADREISPTAPQA